MVEKKFCQGCEEMELGVKDVDGYDLCQSCENLYYEHGDQTGYCSLSCKLGYGCDETCWIKEQNNDKMEKLELNQLKHYLGTGVKFRRFIGNNKFIDQPLTQNNLIWIQDGKLLLHPLSRLTDPILEDGKSLRDLEIIKKDRSTELNHAISLRLNQKPFTSLEFWFVELLFKYHFDVFGLIPKGLAIEKQIEK